MKRARMSWRGWVLAFGRLLAYAVTSALVLLAIAIALSGPSQAERRQTADNVARLVKESETNRQLLCLAILRDEENPTRGDPQVIEICEAVDVMPSEGG